MHPKLYLDEEGLTEEEAIAKSRESHVLPCQRSLDTEELRVLALDEETAGIVGEIVLPDVELSPAEEDFVIVVELEENAVVGGFTMSIFVLTLHSSVVQNGTKGMEGLSAAGLEAVEDLSQRVRHLAGDEEDGMEMVGHELEGDACHFRETC